MRICQNRKWADNNSSKQFLSIKNCVKLLCVEITNSKRQVKIKLGRGVQIRVCLLTKTWCLTSQKADLRLPSNYPRNNCGTHFGSRSLLFSKMTNDWTISNWLLKFNIWVELLSFTPLSTIRSIIFPIINSRFNVSAPNFGAVLVSKIQHTIEANTVGVHYF